MMPKCLLRLIDSRMGQRPCVIHDAAKVAEVYPAAACGTAHVIIGGVDRRSAALLIKISSS
jgi:hypothetical protein